MKSICILSITFVLLAGLSSCGQGRAKVSDRVIEPAIELDSTHILTTLEMYRAPRYSDLETALDSAEKVNKLVLHSQHLGMIPPEVGLLRYLAVFDVAFNDLQELPAELSELDYLQAFYANGNSLNKFPEQLLGLPILTRIDLSENQITEIPPAISELPGLVRLSMDRNAIRSIPVELYKLKDLEVLELKNNGLSSVPEGLASLGSLKKLDLGHNQLSRLPVEIVSMGSHLKELHIQGNQISSEEVNWLIKSMPDTQIRY